MNTNRLEAFSDGVIAVAITIMVLQLQAPARMDFAALMPSLPVFLSYVLSFIYVGIYWNNHHHMLRLTQQVNGATLWANLHLLFWLSLVPFVTSWMGENYAAPIPCALYGVVLLMAAVAYFILQGTIIHAHENNHALKEAIGSDGKGRVSLLIYGAAIACAFWRPWLAQALYIAVALLWLIPDRRIERKIIAADEA
jgi:uncharacterized membrane protein